MAVVGMVVASGFEQADMTAICAVLTRGGHKLLLVSPKKQSVRSWDNTRWNGDLPVDVAAVESKADMFEALVIPGGILSADTLRADEAIIQLVVDSAAQGKVVAALGHGGWVLIEAGLVRGATVTSHPAIRTDMNNAGGIWTDNPFAAHNTIITGRHSHDATTFAEAVNRAVTP